MSELGASGSRSLMMVQLSCQPELHHFKASLGTGGSFSKFIHTLLASLRRYASKLTHIGLSVGHCVVSGFPQWQDPMERK